MGSQKAIGIGMIGCGTVGSGVVQLLNEQRELYARRLGVPLELRHVLVRAGDKANKTEGLAPGVLTTDAEAFFATPDMPILVELGGGRGAISQFVRRALNMGKHVVTANKALLAAEGPELLALARQKGVALAFEASCCGGVPVITALEFGLMANQVQGLYGILNGTCNYILTEMTLGGKTYAAALREAQERGFAEADPTLDVSGRDTAHKLTILASLAFGVRAAEEQVVCTGIDRLELPDIRFGAELGYTIKLLGIAERANHGGRLLLGVQPCFVHSQELLAQVRGPFNALLVCGHATGHTMYYGRGAGKLPTASAVVSDLLNIASGWYGKAFGALNIWPDQQTPAALVDADELLSRFYLRFNALDVPGVIAKISTVLGAAGISLSAVMQHETNVGRFVPLVVTTHQARRGDLIRALDQIERMDVVDGRPVRIRIVDLPEG